MAAVSRNAPCPCGSGKKHKHCCEGKMDRREKRRLTVTVIVLAAGIIAASSAVFWYSTPRNAIFTAVLGVALIGGFLAVRKPPASRGRSGADRIDFGR